MQGFTGKSYVRLTAEQELRAYQSRDYEALVCSQLALAWKIGVKVAKSIGRADLSEDAFAIGALRLVELVRVFDPSRGRLSKLCYLAIEQRVRKELSRMADVGGVKRAVVSGSGFVATGLTCEYCDFDVPVSSGKDEESLPPLRELLSWVVLLEIEAEVLKMRASGLTFDEVASATRLHKRKVRRILESAIGKIVEQCRWREAQANR
jgi:hypothetical protein